MTATLSKPEFTSNRASIEACLRACGAQPWDREDLQQYKRRQEATALAAYFAAMRPQLLNVATACQGIVIAAVASYIVFGALPIETGAILGLFLTLRMIFHFSRLPQWQTGDLLRGDLYWQDGVKRCLPERAQQIVEGTRVFFPGARFAVSFIGRDPVLHVFVNRRCYHALVWEIGADGKIEIVAPPPCDRADRMAC